MGVELKKISLIMYGSLYFLLVAFNAISEIIYGQVSVLIIVGIVFSFMCLVGFIGFVFSKKYLTPRFWRGFFYLLLIVLILPLLLSLSFNISGLFVVLLAFLCILPMLVCIYKYSSPDRLFWFTTSEHLRASEVEELLESSGTIFVSKVSANKKTCVSMTKTNNRYTVKIEREMESFDNVFLTLPRAINFIEEYSSINADDLIVSINCH
jgi:hypothetical protein